MEQNGAILDEDEYLSSLPVFTEILILSVQEEWQSKEELLKQNEFLALNKSNLGSTTMMPLEELTLGNNGGKYKIKRNDTYVN